MEILSNLLVRLFYHICVVHTSLFSQSINKESTNWTQLYKQSLDWEFILIKFTD